MRIGLDISQTGRFKTGCGYFADSLARELIAQDQQNTYILYPTFGNSYWDAEWPTQTLMVPDRANVVRATGQKRLDQLEAFWLDPPVDLESKLGCPDLIHSHNFFCPTTLQYARIVYTLHDLAFLAHPEWTSEANWRTCFEGVLNATAFASHIVAVSGFTRQQLLDAFPYVPAERVSVIHEASRFPSAEATPRSLGRSPRLAHLQLDEFWLAPGTFEPRKNLTRLLDAYARLRDRNETSLPLVLYGGDIRPDDALSRAIEARNLVGSVQRLGYVDDVDLQWLYASCSAFCYPSLFEGFGLPVIEAMSQSAAILTSSLTSLPEVTGDDAILVDPYDIDGLYGGLRVLASDAEARASLGRRARQRANRFSWRQTAASVLNLYERVLSETT